MSDTVLVSASEGVATITLNRPQALNSLTLELKEALLAAVQEVAADPTARAVVLTGAGRGFCAGQDLREHADLLAAGDPAPLETVQRHFNPLCLALATMPKPVVAAVNGIAAGAGANLALACDFVVAAESASFVQSFCHVGLIPDSAGTWMLPRLVGLARATQLAMLGEKLPARQAHEWGMIYQVVPGEQLADAAAALARRLAAMPTRGLALTKQGFEAGAAATLDAQLAREEALQREAGRTADYAEGVRAFVEKRTPTFVGR